MIAHIYKPRRKNKAGKSVPARLYRGRYRLDGDFTVTEVALGTPDKQIAEKKLAAIIAEKERERAGILAPKAQREAARKRMSEHLEDYIGELEALGRTSKHCSQTKYRIQRLIKECHWQHPKDVTADAFGYWRSRQRDMAPKTMNEYLHAMLAMLKWMEFRGRVQDNPLKHVQKADVRGKQAKRRAFTKDEFIRLINVAGRNKILYLTAAYTGLRQNELLSLVWNDLHLDNDIPYLKARASTTKNRKEAILPLHPELANALRLHRGQTWEGSASVFYATRHPERPLFRDMAKAKIEKVDASGRRLDFHSLRYTFATNLAVHGASLRIAQELMRHSDPKLTAQLYTDASQLPTREAINKLPWIEEGIDPQIAPQNLDSDWQKGAFSDPPPTQKDHPKSTDNQQDSRILAATGTDGLVVEVAGVEPASRVLS